MSSPLRIWHPFTNAALDPPPLRVVRAEGVYLYTADGRKILDAVSSWWVNLHAHVGQTRANPPVFFGRRLDGGRGRAKTGRAIFQQPTTQREERDRCAGARLSRRHRRGHVGER